MNRTTTCLRWLVVGLMVSGVALLAPTDPDAQSQTPSDRNVGASVIKCW